MVWPWPEVLPPPVTLAGSTSELSCHDPPCALHLKSPTVPGFSVRIKVQCRKHPFSSMRKHPKGAVDSPRFKSITQVMWSWQSHSSGLNLSVPSIRHRSRPLPRLMTGVKWDNACESTVHVWHSRSWVNLYDSKPMDGGGNSPLPCDSGLAYSTWTRMLDLAHIMQSQSRWELSRRSWPPRALLSGQGVAIHALPMVLWMVLLLSMADSWWLLPPPSAVPHDTEIY